MHSPNPQAWKTSRSFLRYVQAKQQKQKDESHVVRSQSMNGTSPSRCQLQQIESYSATALKKENTAREAKVVVCVCVKKTTRFPVHRGRFHVGRSSTTPPWPAQSMAWDPERVMSSWETPVDFKVFWSA